MIIPKLKLWLQRPSSKPRVIGVVGMHRSGTSFLTGSLQQAGLELHRFHRQNPHNKKGNRENQEIVDLNQQILRDNGGDWNAPPVVTQWSPEHIEQAHKIIEQCATYPIWGFKDPRTLLTIDGWRKVIPNLELVGIFRHPLAVAESLNTREQALSIESGLQLWLHYNSQLLKLYEQRAFPIICFDLDSTLLRQKLLTLCQQLDLKGVGDMDFFDQDLVNNAKFEQQDLPEEILKVYERLQQCAI